MAKKKKLSLFDKFQNEEFKNQQMEYIKTLKENPQYSMLVDPENKYNLTDQQKEFIGLYCEFKNVELAATMCKMDLPEAFKLFSSYAAQQEIRRINLTMYQHLFVNKMLSLQELGGYLTSLLTDDVPFAERLESGDKLNVARLILDLHKFLKETSAEPKNIIDLPIQEDLKELSVNSIKHLLEESKRRESNSSKNEKESLIESFENYENFSQEEITFLKTLSLKELIDLLNYNTENIESEEDNEKDKK